MSTDHLIELVAPILSLNYRDDKQFSEESMAKQLEDKFTRDLIGGEKRPVGRPKKVNALSDVERARAYRARLRERNAAAAALRDNEWTA